MLCNYGEIQSKLTQECILQNDPLVSDTACHIRAPYLVYLANKINKKKPLANDELSFLEDSRVLTKSQSRQYDAFGMIIVERTEIKNIPPEYAHQIKPSNSAKNKFLAEKKKAVAEKSIQFLIKKTKEMVFADGLDQYTDTFNYFILCSLKIPVLPLYLTAKMMLYCAYKYNMPLIVNIRRLKLHCAENEKYYSLDGAKTLKYVYSNGQGKFVPCKEIEKSSEGAIVIDMCTCYAAGAEEKVSNVFTQKTFSEFLKYFKSEDISKVILVCAVAHPQYPLNTTLKDADLMASEERNKILDSSPLEINVRRGSLKEYRQLCTIANSYGFFQNKKFVYANIKAGKICRPDCSVPFFIDHIYSGTFAKAKENISLLKAYHQNALGVPLEEDLTNYNPSQGGK